MKVYYTRNVEFVVYLLGWLINVGYAKFNWMIGLFFIALSNGLLAIFTWIWKNNSISLFSFDFDKIENIEPAMQASGFPLLELLESLALILVILMIIRILTKNISVKIK